MKWHREIDYHGSRTYEPAGPGSGWAARLVARLAAFFRGGTGESAGASPPSLLTGDGERTFSVLGKSNGAQRRHTECPFPTVAEVDDRGRRRASRLRHEN
ncbi:MAG TPA: hypothetical protein VJM15_06115 [Sphingomicrobium sp.]|nr:hypothetical protein [Sphingomicrobium sp.]